jgi:hypothetical protein
VIQDPVARGRALAKLYADLTPRMLQDLEDAGVVPGGHAVRLAPEWECLALYACVRGLIAAGGFNRETAAAIDALHEAALEERPAAAGLIESEEERRARVAARYAEYGAIGQAAEKEEPSALTRRLGEAAARHMVGDGEPPTELAEMIGALHEALAEGAAEAVRRGEEG